MLTKTSVTPSDFIRETASLRAYAAEHSRAVVLANYGSPSGGLASGGGSAIWSENGDLLVQLGAVGAGVAGAEPHGAADYIGWPLEAEQGHPLDAHKDARSDGRYKTA